MKDELVEINRELVETAKKFNMPLRKMGEREKRDQVHSLSAKNGYF